MKKLMFALAVLVAPALILAVDAPVAPKAKPATVTKKVVETVPVKATVAAEKKSTEVLVDDFEAEKTFWTAATFMGDASGMEQTIEDKILCELSTKRMQDGKKSLKIDYAQNPAKDNKFVQISAGPNDKSMGENNALVLSVLAEKGKGVMTVTLYDKDWNKWTSKQVAVEKNEWQKVVLTDADFVNGGKGKWADTKKLQLVLKGAGVFYFDNVKFTKVQKP